MRDICSFVFTGRLTKDPELKSTASGTSVLKMRVAYSTSRKDESGQWVDKPNYIDVTVFGKQAETCAQYLAHGRQVGVVGRLEWREWEATDGSGKRQSYEVIADQVQFLGGPPEAGAQRTADPGQGQGQQPAAGASYTADFPASAADDDIPF